MFKKGQEEMVGFAMIIILVAVILLAFLGFSLTKETGTTDSYEVNNFIQALLQSTNSEYLTVKDLIFECGNGECDELNTTLLEILNEAWPVGVDWPNKGYKLIIREDDSEILRIEEGNTTKNYKSGKQDLPRRRKMFSINFKVYS